MKKRGVFSPAANKRRRHLGEIRRMGRLITSQAILEDCLLEVDDVEKRVAMYELVKPHLKFRSTFPTRLNVPVLVAPSAETLVHRPRPAGSELLVPRIS